MLRRARTVHTIASAPDNLEHVAPMLFANRVVALSKHTAARLERSGITATVIPPALAPISVSKDSIARARERHRLPERFVLYPGDLEFGDGAQTFVTAAAKAPELGWVVASRPKTPRAREARESLEALARESGAPIVWLGEIDDIHAVVAAASLVSLVSNTLHAKMDWPLVLLEALALEVPVLVARGGASEELEPSGAATPLPSGHPDALVAAARTWLDVRENSARREALASASQWVASTCGPSVVARAHEALYDELLA
jgi:phosphatidylinositol alpha-1,6-mannosyltransferase